MSRSLVTPRHRCVMMHEVGAYKVKQGQILSYTPQFDATLRNKGYNIRPNKTWNAQIDL